MLRILRELKTAFSVLLYTYQQLRTSMLLESLRTPKTAQEEEMADVILDIMDTNVELAEYWVARVDEETVL